MVAVVGMCYDVSVAAVPEASRLRCCHGAVLRHRMPQSQHRADLFLLLLPLLDGAGRRGDQVVRHGVRGRPVRQQRREGGAAEDVVPQLVVREHQLRHHAVGEHPRVRAGQCGVGVGLRRAHGHHGAGHARVPGGHSAIPPPDALRQPAHACGAGGVLRGEEMEHRRALQP